MIRLNKEEWKFLIIISLIIIPIIFLPIIIGYLITPPDMVFIPRSAFVNWGDYPVYFSYIEQAKAGNFLFQNLFTVENQSVFIFSPFWLGVGILAKVFNLSTYEAFHLVRLLLIPILLIVSYYFIALFFKEEFKRKICFIFLLFSSGAYQMINPDAFFFTVLYSNPHFVLSLALIIAIFLISILAFEKNKLRYSLLCGFLSFVLFSFHPYQIPTIFGVLFIFIIIDMITNKKVNFSYIGHYLILILFSLPPIFYYWWQLKNNPTFYGWSLQNITLNPSIWVVLIGYSIILPLSIIGIFSIFKKGNLNQRNLFLIIWLSFQILLVHIPVSIQRRLANGLEVPMIILAVYGIFYIAYFLKTDKLWYLHFTNNRLNQILLGSILILYISFFNILVFISDVKFYFNETKDAFIDKKELSAMTWLKNNTRDSKVIFSSFENGGLIAFLSLRKVFIAHHHETINFTNKEKALNEFYKEKDGTKRLSFIENYNIDYLFVGPKERERFSFDLDNDKFLEKVYNNDSVSIYKVRW